MRKESIASFLFLFCFLFLHGRLAAAADDNSKISSSVGNFLRSSEQEPIKIWVYFSDHGDKSDADLVSDLERVRLSQRALTRRMHRSRGSLVDLRDLPPSPRYIQAVKSTGSRIRKISKYFNAVSAEATAEQVRAISRFPFVKLIDRVAVFKRKRQPGIKEEGSPGPSDIKNGVDGSQEGDPLYGPSFKQLDLMNVIPLHQEGFHGEGVLVAMLDTGFRLRHVSLNHLDVIAQWDFINNDSITEYQPGDPSGQDNHGTITLSSLAGYAPGELIGPAWAASFALAKTERTDTEIEIEEDDWVRGLEWADSLGAEVVSSSLGYYYWYTYADMDGNTAVTTKAADIAAAKGITVVTAAGNEGPLPWPGIIAPSDGDSVIAVGAVDSNGVIVSFSSRGPSYDGRIKPDVVAQGLEVVCAVTADSLGFSRSSGTSLSTPLVAGACALLLQIHPYWTPMDVISALKTSASQTSSPNNNYGWGIINAYASAMNGSTGVEGAFLDYEVLPDAVKLSIFTPNARSAGFDLLRRKFLFSDAGTWSPFTAIAEDFAASSYTPFIYLDKNVSGGTYQYRIEIHGDDSAYQDLGTVLVPWRFSLLQNYPNPFSPSMSAQTLIRFDISGYPSEPESQPPLSSYVDVSLEIYDVRGSLVKNLYSGLNTPGEYSVPWDGTNNRNVPVASGVYYYRLSVDGATLSRKILVIKP